MAVDMTDLLPPRYRGPQKIGRGGMGDIYRATDATLGRAVAVKILGERYSEDDGVRQRFTREALAAARLSGTPNIITIFDVGEHNDRPYIVMEYLSGGSLEDVLRAKGAQPPETVLRWLEQAAKALDAAQAEGVVHRDVKPANLLLDRNGDVHVADFGVASAGGLDSMTATGTILGTAGYLSPEQAQGNRATPASDRYALAIVAFELLTGSRPFEADSMTAEAAAHVNAPVPSVCDRLDELPCELDPVFQRALAKDPAARYPSAAEFVAALRQALHDAAGQTQIVPPRVAAAAPMPAAAPVERQPRREYAPPPGPPAPRPPAAMRRSRGWMLLLGLLIAAGAVGAILAALLTAGGGKQTASPSTAAPQPRAETKTVVRQGDATTVVVTTAPPAATTAAASPSAGTTSATVTGNPRALNDQGYALMRRGDYAGALPLLQQSVHGLQGQGFPYEAYANFNLGYTLLKLGRCPEAITYLKKAQKLEPQRPEPGQAIAQAKSC
jgi:serine/threonine-protein kinase